MQDSDKEGHPPITGKCYNRKKPWISRSGNAPKKKLIRRVLMFGIVLFFFTHKADPKPFIETEKITPEIVTSKVPEVQINLPPQLPVPEQESPGEIEQENTSTPKWHIVTIKKNENLSLIFSRLGLSSQQLYSLLLTGKATKRLKHLMPGQQLKFMIDGDKLEALIYEINKTQFLSIDRDGERFQAKIINRDLEERLSYATGTIGTSLFAASRQAGLSNKLTMELANILGWDIDFALDVRAGDQFSVVYEAMFLDGEKINNGNILAAKFINRGTTYRAAFYTSPEGKSGYYTPNGQSMRKAFLRTPVDFTRISSDFGMRYHTILNRMRAHKGTDYAAPRGTLIKSTGDGNIAFMGTKGGYGKTIIISHGNGYKTLYSHMSRFKRGLRKGRRVKQGQTIGYVGSTGLATGPHLHYEFRVNGVHRDPVNVKLPGSSPIKAKYIADFASRTKRLFELVENPGKITVALNK